MFTTYMLPAVPADPCLFDANARPAWSVELANAIRQEMREANIGVDKVEPRRHMSASPRASARTTPPSLKSWFSTTDLMGYSFRKLGYSTAEGFAMVDRLKDSERLSSLLRRTLADYNATLSECGMEPLPSPQYEGEINTRPNTSSYPVDTWQFSSMKLCYHRTTIPVIMPALREYARDVCARCSPCAS